MKLYITRSVFVTLSFIGILFGVSCSTDDDGFTPPLESQPDIVELAVSIPELSTLVEALNETGLVSALQADGPFTVFAPSNDAFTDFLGDNGFASLQEVPVELLTQILLNHVVSGTYLASDLTTGYLSSSSTDGPEGANLSLFVNTENGVRINGLSRVAIANEEASNGVVHMVDAVIGLPNIVDHATFNPSFSTLLENLTLEGNTAFTSLLADEGPYTVFAPLNEAFGDFENPDGNDLNNILANHVVGGVAAFSSGLNTSYTNSLGENPDEDLLSLYINTDVGVLLNGISEVVLPDVVATNGVIHAVNAVIDIPTVATFASADPNFSNLLSALTEGTPDTDFAGILSRTQTGNEDGLDPYFTVFAPINEAFDALGTLPDAPVLTEILLHHVVSGNLRSEDLTDGSTPTTLEGDRITIGLPGTGTNIADITDGAGNSGIGIILVDVQAGNGVIHALDQVLIPNFEN